MMGAQPGGGMGAQPGAGAGAQPGAIPAAQPGGGAVRIVIVDDDALVRTLLGRILGAQGFAVVGEGADGDEAVDLVRAHHPNVVLMDLRMARMSGIEATRLIRQLPGAPGVVALTSFDTPAAVLDAVGAGVAGFLAKDAAPEEIVHAVRQVAAGAGALSPRAAAVVLDSIQGSTHGEVRRAARARLREFSPRELEAARGVAEGLSNGEIAGRLYVSEGTVKSHVQSALAKSGAENRVQLAVLVAQADSA